MPKGQSHHCGLVFQVSCGKITVSDLLDHLNYRVIFIVYTECVNVAMGHIVQPGRQLVGEPCTMWRLVFHFLAALFLGNKTPIPIEWEAGFTAELVRVF
jgi:hypothetical protein